MIPSLACLDLIRRFEGCKLVAYLCPAGKWTIGYGHTEGVKEGKQIGLEQAEELLRQFVERLAVEVKKALRVPVSQTQFDALVSFVYNIGGPAFRRSTLLRKLNASDLQGAATEFPKWVRAKGKVLPGLVKRRAAERALFLT